MPDRKEPPIYNDDSVGTFQYKLPFYETMELFIETLTGTCFELRVSPIETVISVKAKIQRLEDSGYFWELENAVVHAQWVSGEYAGQGRTGTFSASRNCVHILATWGCALSG
ncbi:unnamed protein product [Oncorhynchus mykiss]|uniref:Zinc finger AN1-type containing 4 n=1 Tax=Oncorhynchus mykiss TaxID=8022 RepID=A0A060XTX7_ONCMY|nr:unnamed protein product [Oncorhynchus mykiss]